MLSKEQDIISPELALVGERIAAREEMLQKLLGTDYEFAHQSGLIDMFYFNPDTGADGIAHILGGEGRISESGALVYEGFHHEPSGNMIWPTNPETGEPLTRVDRTHLESANAHMRREFSEEPFEPYRARVDINGRRKMSLRPDRKTGEITLAETNNGMYPKEYDALAVLQAVRFAVETRDATADETIQDASIPLIVNKSATAPMLDGENTFKVRLVLEADTHKVINAIPVPKARGVMRLDPNEVSEHLGL